MTNDSKPDGYSWKLLIAGYPLTFVLVFIFGMVWDWRAKPFAANFGGSLLDAVFFTMAFAVVERLFHFFNAR